MKKYFILLATAAVLFSACQTEQPEQTKKETINSEVVYRVPGQSSPFYAPFRGADVNGNTWSEMPATVTSQEIADVLAYIATKPASVAWPTGCTEYYIQHVAGAHHMYAYQDMNGAWHTNIDGTASMEMLSIKEISGNWVAVPNFNGGKCDNSATHNAARMTDGLTDVRTTNEYSSSIINNWRLFFFNGAYYLGIDFCQKKGDGEIYPDGVYDDWVVKIIPINGAKEPETTDPGKGGEDIDPDDPDAKYGKAHVEFDIHQQEHKDWKEIKTSIHIRDTVDIHVLLPIPADYQAPADDFAIRAGESYEYISKSIEIADEEFSIMFVITHKAEGIEIYVGGADCAAALRAARTAHNDGLTFEVHTYVKNEIEGVPVDDELIWNFLKQSTVTSDPTHLFGQITSAFYNDSIYMDNWKDRNKHPY